MSLDDLDIEKKMLLLARIDPERFHYFFEKYYDRLYRYIYYRTLSREVAEDLTSETFARALDNLNKFRWQGVTFGAWLYRIALNLVRLHYKRRNRYRRYGVDSLNGHESPDPGPLAELLRSEEQRRLYTCLSELDELSVEIFILYYWDDLSVKQIAVILKTKEGTIQSRLKRDRDKMREILQKDRRGPGVEQSLKAARAAAGREDLGIELDRGGDD